MDVMEIRRRIIEAMSNATMFKSGTFMGNGTASVTIDMGFEPDVVIIDSGHRYNNPGFAGLMQAILIKGIIITNICHQSDTATNSLMYGNPIGEGQDVWGYKETPVSNTSYALYSNGQLTLTNASPQSASTRLKNNHQ